MNEIVTSIIRVVEGQLVRGEEFQRSLATLKQLAQNIVVHSQETCAEAREICKKGQDEINQIFAAAEPQRLYLKRQLDEFTASRDKMAAEFASVIDPLAKAAREYNVAEVQGARKEQVAMNKGVKPAERAVVKPNITPVAGTRFVPHFDYTVVNISKIDRAFMMDNPVKIRAEIRADWKKQKSPVDTEKRIGGIRITIS
jgi:hypothetical protein